MLRRSAGKRETGRFRFGGGWVLTIPLVVAGAAPLFGCASFKKESANSTAASRPSVAIEDDAAQPNQDTLSAVEEFLARTQEYRLAPTAAPVPKVVPTASAESKRPADGTPGSAAPNGAASNGAAAVPASPQAPALRDRDVTYANAQISVTETRDPVPAIPIPAVESVTIRWNDPNAVETAAAPKSNATNAPMDVQAASPALSLDRLIPTLQQQLETSRDFASEWRLRMVQLALDRDADATMVSAHLSEESRQLLSSAVGAVAAVRNLIRNPMLTGEEAMRQTRELERRLADRADPEVTAVALCRKVTTFGSYDEMAKEEFIAGRSIQTIVYSEIQNLRSKPVEGSGFETRLSTRLEVLTKEGQSVWTREEPEIVDQCRRRRSDFFIAQRVTLPPTLPAGDYVFKVFVEDKLSGKAGESLADFTILSPVSVAKSTSGGH